jgi:alkanesulfonate monooxygenase SsuD/methylene tetrahydromethanopterin reductase-like flavin-dependent oxidoreductase (luciferase family)
VSRWITKQTAVPSLSRLVTAAAALNVTNGSRAGARRSGQDPVAVADRAARRKAPPTIQTAKLVASLDQVSKGRFLFGIGCGWNAEEIEDHGTV